MLSLIGRWVVLCYHTGEGFVLKDSRVFLRSCAMSGLGFSVLSWR